ncbi:uncharacterized protein UV8b_05100 [Ustilaginoidea virens]|uniref:Uncharacterized protein n=1 Tax=Ustilaginoidea virens TaxID=1159556 RepID=A0A063BTV7_USTVR|nr:uncharacterized protein UV8b_05100 [Ustilaginoidea virens]QUC20859.1 hypothetical protein UV8b_05100 [Ustilaginoidea virens]GAO14931.1 hypothetical protein UVI_02007690 [Ustilaginoidea virens]
MVSQPDHPSPPASSSSTALDLSTSSSRRSHHHDHHDHHDQHQHHHQLKYSATVASRPSLSRSRRYNRSHLGGSSCIPQNEFPVFAHSGDVQVVIRVGAGAHAAENRYLLHRHTLTRCSGFFEASTSSEWSRARPCLPGPNEPTLVGDGASSPLDGPDHERRLAVGGGGAGAGAGGLNGSQTSIPAGKRWKYELDSGAGDGDIPMLVQKDDADTVTTPGSEPPFPSLFGAGCHHASDAKSSGSRSKHRGPPAPAPAPANRAFPFSRSVANLSVAHLPLATAGPGLSQADEDLLRDYDNLFRVFYNYAPVLDAVSVADAYVQCKSLLALADQYDALAVVGPRVDHHLLQFQSRLWKQIAKYPISYLRLGYLARSRVIFQEALVHVVGQWQAGERSLRAALPDIVLDIVEDKVDELGETVSRVQGELFRLSLTTTKGERVTPTNSYLDWLVVSLFRQWLADNIPVPSTPGRNSGGGGGGGGSSSIIISSSTLASASYSYPNKPPPRSTGRAYRILGSRNPSAFLNHDECKKFLKLTPELYTRNKLCRFEKRMEELKAMARHLVHPLLGSRLELAMAGSGRAAEGISYLTCTTLGNRDLPWFADP